MIKFLNNKANEYNQTLIFTGPYPYRVLKALQGQLPALRLMLRILALCCWSVFADAAGMAVSAACQFFRLLSFFVTITLSEAENVWGDSRELDCSIRSVMLWCCLGFGMAESSQDMRIAATACGLAGAG